MSIDHVDGQIALYERRARYSPVPQVWQEADRPEEDCDRDRLLLRQE